MDQEIRLSPSQLDELIKERTLHLTNENKQLKKELEDYKKKEKILREKENYFRFLIEYSLDFTVVLDDNGIINYISPSVEKVSKFSTYELIGQKVFNFIHPEDVTSAFEIFTRIIYEPDTIQSAKLRFKDKEDSYHYVEFIGKNFLNTLPVKGVIINAREIGQRIQAEEELRRYQQIISKSRDYMAFVDRTYSYQAVNDAYLRTHKKKRCQIVGHTISELFGPELFENTIRPHLDKCFNGDEIHYQWWMTTPEKVNIAV